MKKVLYIFSLIGLLAFSSCADELNTEPTDKVSGSTIFADASSAETAINGIYLDVLILFGTSIILSLVM